MVVAVDNSNLVGVLVGALVGVLVGVLVGALIGHLVGVLVGVLVVVVLIVIVIVILLLLLILIKICWPTIEKDWMTSDVEKVATGASAARKSFWDLQKVGIQKNNKSRGR